MGQSQNAYVVNYTFMLDRKARHSARIVAHAVRNDIATIEPEQDAQDRWVEATRNTGLAQMFYLAGCTPGYYNGQGDITRGFFNEVYQVSEIEYWTMIEDCWETGRFDGLVLR